MKNINKIAIIIPYFGKFPNTFEMWKESCKKNSNIDWIIVTDLNFKEENNIKKFFCTMDEIQKRASNILGIDVKISHPYKLCDYRPLYGGIFQDILSKYDFWGHCDMDMIFGNISNFITEDILYKYDKLFINGHFVLYRNCMEVNNWWKKYSTEKLRKEVFLSKEVRAFDEFGINGNGMACLVPKTEKVYFAEVFDDLSYSQLSFTSTRLIDNKIKPKKAYPMLFEFDNGILYRYARIGKKLYKDESMYVHFQKRNLKTFKENELYQHYFLVPNKLVLANEFNNEMEIKKACKYKPFYFAYYIFRYKNLKRKIVKFFNKLKTI